MVSADSFFTFLSSTLASVSWSFPFLLFSIFLLGTEATPAPSRVGVLAWAPPFDPFSFFLLTSDHGHCGHQQPGALWWQAQAQSQCDPSTLALCGSPHSGKGHLLASFRPPGLAQ